MRKLGLAVAFVLLSAGVQGFADETRHSGTQSAAVGQIHDSYRAASDPARSDSSSNSSRSDRMNSGSSSRSDRNSRERTSEHNRL
jgi:hypothetical protein